MARLYVGALRGCKTVGVGVAEQHRSETTMSQTETAHLIRARAQRSEALRDPETANGVAIVWEGWKLIHNSERPPDYPEYELFNHREDPLSLVNVANEHPEKVEELAGHLESWRRWVDAQHLPTDAELTQGVSSEELERLRSLGYVQ